jgi:hypothetical protein
MPFAALLRSLSRLLRQVTAAIRLELTTKLAPDVIEVRVPHPDVDLNDFWAFQRTD